ncbi:hypothetical protein ACIQWR_04570 [Streptomyces sp. NPDC098789]|uniref:hypothetical protein n=1 Tax=Streptomyces sp. NPDC098789 TaxID=3366098 RepID=UPI0037F9DB85
MTVDIAQSCPGLFDAAGAEALSRVLQSSYMRRDDEHAVGASTMAEQLEAAYRAGSGGKGTVVAPCVVTGQVGTGRSAEIRMSVIGHGVAPGGGVPSGAEKGVRESRREKAGGVAFDCVSPALGSTAEAPLRIDVTFENQWSRSDEDGKLATAYLTIARSAARAVAAELNCTGGGGLTG